MFLLLQVHLSFLYVGHTHEDIDAAFSQVADALRTTDVETMSDLFTLLKNPQNIDVIFDVKSWLTPSLNDIEKHSEPLHFKFVNRGTSNVGIYFKGQQNDPWIELNGKILKHKPVGIPNILKPDYSKINFDKQIKQIEVLSTLFKKKDTVKIWKKYYSELQSSKKTGSQWILDILPRQGNTSPYTTASVPPEVRELIQKETHVPQVNECIAFNKKLIFL